MWLLRGSTGSGVRRIVYHHVPRQAASVNNIVSQVFQVLLFHRFHGFKQAYN